MLLLSMPCLGNLQKGSDVYSYGVVLLELLSGKNVVLSMSEGRTLLLADWDA